MTDKENLLKYIELYNVYKNVHDDTLKYSLTTAMLVGVWMEINIEVTKYIKKNNKEPTSALNRLKIIKKAIDSFDYLINENQRQFELNNLLMNKNAELETKLKEAQNKLSEILEFQS